MKAAFAILIFAYPHLTLAQGTFDNLDFEQANPVNYVGGEPWDITTASAIPDWTAAIGGTQQSYIVENFFSAGSPEVVLLTSSSPLPPIDGGFSVMLTGTSAAASISQVGGIPSGTESLLFDAFAAGGAGNGILSVQVGTETVPIVPLLIEPNYTVYGANISAWAGDTESLTFTALQSATGLNNWEIDDISFSPQAVVPEPNPLALAGIGTALFALYRRFTVKRQ